MARLHTRRLQRQDQWQQYTADLCAPAATAIPGPAAINFGSSWGMQSG